MSRIHPDDLLGPRRKEKPVPHAFVLDALATADPLTRPMFGCTAVYVEDKIVLILRDKPAGEDNGVWVATTAEHHESLRADLPSLKSISVLGPGVTGWQMIPDDAPEFEEEALRAVRLVLAGDPRIGKVPKGRKPKEAREPSAKKTAAKKITARKAKATAAKKTAAPKKTATKKAAAKKTAAKKTAAKKRPKRA